jgi:hypothetical protein
MGLWVNPRMLWVTVVFQHITCSFLCHYHICISSQSMQRSIYLWSYCFTTCIFGLWSRTKGCSTLCQCSIINFDNRWRRQTPNSTATRESLGLVSAWALSRRLCTYVGFVSVWGFQLASSFGTIFVMLVTKRFHARKLLKYFLTNKYLCAVRTT